MHPISRSKDQACLVSNNSVMVSHIPFIYFPPTAVREVDAATFAEGPQASLGAAEEGLNDSLQQLDWNAFMDDFDWSFTSNYLNAS